MQKKNIFNRKKLKSFRKELRNNLTPAEAILWSALKNKQLEGRKFRRQHSIGKYVADFYCPREKMIIELDGADHFTPAGIEHDEKRDNYIRGLGIKIIRFENNLVYNHLEEVLEEIKNNFRD
ncbi:MAG: endonuclease domain-containing protein [Chlorobi bacterium]|nr:endonuclease domain-containing protein [Chlorobiota bacterium]